MAEDRGSEEAACRAEVLALVREAGAGGLHETAVEAAAFACSLAGCRAAVRSLLAAGEIRRVDGMLFIEDRTVE